MAINRDEIIADLEQKQGDGNYKTRQIIVFKQGVEEYALTIEQIKEVVLTPNITRMPQSAKYIKGVANIRGNIIAIVDLEEKFGLSDGEKERLGKYTLVIDSEEFKVGILVEEVPNTLNVSEADIDNSLQVAGDNGVASDTAYMQGVIKYDDRLIILIDIFKVMNESEIQSIT